MKYIPRHTHSLEMEFSNKGFLLFRATFPIKNKSINISEWYKCLKIGVANSQGIPVWRVKANHKKVQSVHFDKILFEWAGGFALELPDNVNEQDLKIVLHYLEGIKMSL